MKKVLILAYDFPPYVSVGGMRPYIWYKYLHEFGIYPVVITRQWSNKHGNHLDYIAAGESDQSIIQKEEYGTVIKAPYFPNLGNKLLLKYGVSKFKFVRKLLSAYYEFVQFLFVTGPKSSLYQTAKEYLKENQVDVIIASGDPFILFKYASELSAKFKTPWIADYRDIWSQVIPIQENFLLKTWHSFFEKKIVSTSSFITTVSPFLQIKVSSLIKNKDFAILTNGYDPELLFHVKDIQQQSDALSIAYVGSIYNWHPIRSFLSVISQFIKNNKNVKLKLNFYGIVIAELDDMIARDFPELKEYATIHPKIPNELLLKELSKNNLMLLLNSFSYIGTKIYEYIGIRRKIILCYANDKEGNELKKKFYDIEEIEGISTHLQEDLIKETNSGIVIQDSQHLLEVLNDLYDEFINTGQIQCDTINAENYSRTHQVKQLAEVINRIS